MQHTVKMLPWFHVPWHKADSESKPNPLLRVNAEQAEKLCWYVSVGE